MSEESKRTMKVDLVFKLSQSVQKFKDSNISKSSFVFDFSFWKDAFTKWITCVITEKGSKFYKNLKKNSFSLSFEIINDSEIEKLNKKWLNKAGSTDVLSFPIVDEDYHFGDLDFVELGDLFVSYEKALSQSLEQNHSFQAEIIWLASHGFLHLLGWEHHNERELMEMLDFQHYLISILDLDKERLVKI